MAENQQFVQYAFNGAFFMGLAFLLIVIFFGIPLALTIIQNKIMLWIFGGIFIYAFVKKHL